MSPMTGHGHQNNPPSTLALTCHCALRWPVRFCQLRLGMSLQHGMWPPAARGVTLAIALLACPVTGNAQSTTGCEADPICKGMYERAQSQSAQGNYSEAAKLYQLAYQVIPDPRIHYSLARVLHKDGREAEARPYYQKFIESALDDPQQKDKARQFLEQIPPPASSVSPGTAPTGASDPTASSRAAPPPASAPSTTETAPAVNRRFPAVAGAMLATGGATILCGIIVGGLALGLNKSIVATDAKYDLALFDRGTAYNRAAIALDVIGGTLLVGGATWGIVWAVRNKRRVTPLSLTTPADGRAQ